MPHTPIKFTQRPSLFAHYALQNREEHFANFGRALASFIRDSRGKGEDFYGLTHS